MINILKRIRSSLFAVLVIFVFLSWIIFALVVSLRHLKSDESNFYSGYVHDAGVFHNSNFGDSDQYKCTGFCYCESYEGDRRVSSPAAVSPLIYIVTALTSVVAMKIAKMHFEEECAKGFHDDHCDSSNFFSEVDNCEPLFTIEEEEVDELGKPVYEYDEKTPFFVYGTLRPDADRNVQWCEWWNESNELRSRKGYLKNCDLYMGEYPFIVLGRGGQQGSSWKDHVCFGYVQDFYPRMELEEYDTALEILDDVEGCPRLYLRKLVDVHLLPDDHPFDKEAIRGDERSVVAHAYYMEDIVFHNYVRISSGDFLNVWGD